jgi:hypothetical protein
MASDALEMELPIASLEARMEQLQRELVDIKRILVLLQHRAVVLTLLQGDEGWRSWPKRFLSWMRGPAR